MELREKIAEIVFQLIDPGPDGARECALATADTILALPEIEAGLGLYLASIEEREEF